LQTLKSVSINVKNLRIQNSLSQHRFGYKIGVSGKTISAYENGKCIPPLRILEKISEVYKVSVTTITVSSEDILLNRIKKLQEDLNEITRLIQCSVL
jgi:transcriptional regulator with XRE-family HTH domain